jgi:hypothetical protein
MNSIHENDKQKYSRNKNEMSAIITVYIKNFRKAGITALATMSKHEQSIIVKWSQDVVQQFEELLKKLPMKINDTAILPHRKESIKIAIKTLLLAYVAKESDEIINSLKDRYILLNRFQEIRTEDIDTVYKEANAIEQKSDSTDISLFPTYYKYMQVAVSEQKALIDEIKSIIREFQTQSKDF